MTEEHVKTSSGKRPIDCEYAVLGSQEDGESHEKVERSNRSKLFTVEPLILGIVFCGASSAAVITNLITRQACHQLGATTSEECLLNATLENEAQTTTADIQAINVALSSVIPIFICIFVGPWSDTNGRKPFLNVTVFGHFLYYTLYAGLASILNLNPTYFIAPALILMLTGGPSTFIMLTFCYLSDVSTVQNKTFRMGLGVASALLAGSTGPLFGNWLYGDGSYWGFVRVLATNSIVCGLMFVYSTFILPETVVTDIETKKRLFAWDHCLGIFIFMKKKRPGKEKLIIILILLIIIDCTVFVAGENEVLFLTLKKQFRWDVDQFSKLTAFCQALTCFCTTFGIWLFSSYLKVSDFATMSVTLSVYIVAMIMFANARTSNWVYVTNSIGSCGRMTFPLYKSMIAKAVDVKEIGTALTVAQIFESLFGAIFTAVYAKIYGLVVSHSPLDVYYVSASFAGFGLLTLFVLEYVRRSEAPR